jgi:NitT/TauT family transport system substrate-binding protein
MGNHSSLRRGNTMKRFCTILFIVLTSTLLLATQCVVPATPEAVEKVVTVEVEKEVVKEVEVPVEPDVVTLRLNWLPGGYHGWLFYGVEQGYFLENNIVVKLREGNGSGNVSRSVASGDDDFAYISPDPGLVMISEEGPIKFIYTIDGANQGGIICRNDRGIETAADLEGKTILSTPGSSMNVIWPTFVEKAGIDESTIDYTLVSPGTEVPVTLAGEADCINGGLNGQAVQMAQEGHEPFLFPFDEFGIGGPGGALITHMDIIDSNPDLVRRLVHAAAKAHLGCSADPEACMDAIAAVYPQTEREVFVSEFEANEPYMFSSKNPNKCPGMFAEDDWNDLLGFLKASESIESDMPITEYYTSEFLPECE